MTAVRRNIKKSFDSLFQKCFTQGLLRNEKGQALTEYSLLIGISSAFASVIAVLRDHSIIVIVAVVALLIFLLLELT